MTRILCDNCGRKIAVIEDGLNEEQYSPSWCDDCLYEDDQDDYYDESMDGDHASALASAGWGTDEDYGYYGEDF